MTDAGVRRDIELMKFLSTRIFAAILMLGLVAGTNGIARGDHVLMAGKLPKSVIVIGDSLAEGIYAGFYRLMKPAGKINVQKKTRINTGLVRYDKYNWLDTVNRIAASKKFDVAIVSFGANDQISFRGKGRPTHFGEEKWPVLYEQRIGDIVTRLKKAGIRVYWVGLPIVNKPRFKKDYEFLNRIFKKAAIANGAQYIDTWQALAPDGKYSDFGKDINGKKFLLRNTDGIHFTPDGYLVYAKIVADQIMPSGWPR